MKYREFISAEDISSRIMELGSEIKETYQKMEGELVGIGLLRGSFVFMADLVRAIDYSMEVDFMKVSSYGESTVSSGKIKILSDLDISITGKHILIIEDIIDSGITLSAVTKLLMLRDPLSIRIVTLLNKPSRHVENVKIDYTGFEIPDKFVFGFGLDYKQRFRNLPFIAVKE